MAIATANVDPSQSFYVWLNRTNELAARMTSNVVTADSTAGGSVTNGNSYVNGHFGAVTLYANTLIGGNVSTNAAITVVANVLFVNSTSNLMTLTSNGSLTALTVNASATRILSDNTVISGGNLTINTATVSFSSNVNFASAVINGNLTMNTTSLSLTDGNFVLANTPISGNLTLQSNLIFSSSAGLIANGAVGSNGNVLFSNGTSVYWGTVETASIVANSGIVSNSSGIFVNANSGLVANSTGLFAVGNTGLASNSTGIHVVANSGVIANATGVFVNANSGLVSNSTGVFVRANNGIVANATGTFVQANSGIVANATGVFVNASYIATLSANAATYATSSATNNFTIGTAAYFLSNGNFGIANTTAIYKLSVQGDAAISGGIYANGTFGTSGQVLYSNGTGIYWSNTSGGGATLTSNNSSSQTYYLPMANTTSGSWSNGVVSDTKLYFVPYTGTLNATVFNSLSDVAYKTDISSIPNGLQAVLALKGVEFNWKDTNQKSAGVLAQEIEGVLPHLVSTSSSGIKSVNYDSIIAYLIEAIKDLNAKLEAKDAG